MPTEYLQQTILEAYTYVHMTQNHQQNVRKEYQTHPACSNCVRIRGVAHVHYCERMRVSNLDGGKKQGALSNFLKRLTHAVH